MQSPERQSLIRFVALFIALNAVFLTIISIMYYHYQKDLLTRLRQESMQHFAKVQLDHIREVRSIDAIAVRLQHLVRDPHYEVAFLNQNKEIVYTSLSSMVFPFKEGLFSYHDYFFYIEPTRIEHLSTVQYIVIRSFSIHKELDETQRHLVLFWIFSVFFLSVAAYMLSKLFLYPVKNTIETLDRFIRDTTHELNTPLTIINMSIEQLKHSTMLESAGKHISRIDVASRTISNLYNDLAFVLMYERLAYKDIPLDLRTLVEERIEYFRPLADTKKITIRSYLDSSIVHIAREKASRMLDNLLSNAIKYNKPNGSIDIVVSHGTLEVKDTGIGISAEHQKQIFDRYKRFDEANGGFGIGLNLIQKICNEYHLVIQVDSTVGKGSTFTIRWM